MSKSTDPAISSNLYEMRPTAFQFFAKFRASSTNLKDQLRSERPRKDDQAMAKAVIEAVKGSHFNYRGALKKRKSFKSPIPAFNDIHGKSEVLQKKTRSWKVFVHDD
ncbi:hypothetical protein KIN20_034195 [Parelaphostrongylus tenuis]|uniref:Uncharacterized protein n=1 Tax=Parelaphostrongylus tenuis TaxID=148309 RepID=A0AAD5R939_PARTN|nr:hypothetical protein KIN20_034195 [Parelaphostrongylus tenuis]